MDALKAARQSGTIIRIAGVTKRFGAVTALDDVSLDLREGEFFCLLGPSGCGKSTLLRVLAGFETVEAGRIELDGTDISAVPPHRRPLNMMFQSYALFPHLTVAGNIGYGLKLAGLARAEREERLSEMLRLTGLAGLERRYPAQLSGGQRQRVALARALARRPRVLLLDEPLGALDRALRERTRAELKALQVRLGTTFVTVTHDQDEAMGLADRIGIMDAGRLAQIGTPRDVYERPRSRFVAGFVGSANTLEGVLVSREDVRCRVRLTAGAEIAGRTDADLRDGQVVAVVVRPERVRLARFAGPLAPQAEALGIAEPRSTQGRCASLEASLRGAPQDEEGVGIANVLPGTLVDLAFLGASTMVRVALADGAALRLDLGPAETDRLGAMRPGDPVRVAFAPADAHVLP